MTMNGVADKKDAKRQREREYSTVLYVGVREGLRSDGWIEQLKDRRIDATNTGTDVKHSKLKCRQTDG